jgi:hypothetical protein
LAPKPFGSPAPEPPIAITKGLYDVLYLIAVAYHAKKQRIIHAAGSQIQPARKNT